MGVFKPIQPLLYGSNLASFLATQPIFGTFQRLHVCLAACESRSAVYVMKRVQLLKSV